MSLTPQDARNGANEALLHARETLDESSQALKEGRIGVALHLTLLAIEELGKADILIQYEWEKSHGYRPAIADYEFGFTRPEDIADPRARKKMKDRKQRLGKSKARIQGSLFDPLVVMRRDHNIKYQRFVNWLNLCCAAGDYFGKDYFHEHALISRSDYSPWKSSELEQLREDAMYVDFEESSHKWSTPRHLSSTTAEELLSNAEHYASWIQTSLQKGFLYLKINNDIGQIENPPEW